MSWSVSPHGPLEEAAPGVWYVDGTLPPQPLPRRMVIWRLPDDGICIHSAVNVDETTLDVILGHGEPRILIVPSRLHRADAPAWKDRFPDIEVVAPSFARDPVEKVIPVDQTAEQVLPPLGIGCLVPDGVGPLELVYRVPCGKGHVLVMTDLLFNIQEHLPGIGGLFARWITGSTGFFGMTRLGRWLGLKDRAAFARWLREQADDPGLKAVLVAHGDPILESPGDRLRDAAARLH